MSYSYRETPTGGELKSHITKKTFSYERDPAGKGRRQALADLRVDEKVYSDARAKRPPATPKPTHADKVINTTHDEKLAQTRLIGHKPRWQEESAGGRAAVLQARLAGAKTDAEVSAINRRLQAMGLAQQRGENKAATRQAQDDRRTSPEYLAAIADAEQVLDSLSRRDDLSEDYIVEARHNLINLKRSANVEAYRESEKMLSDKYQTEADARVSEAEAMMDKLRASIAGVRPIEAVAEADSEAEVSPDATQSE